MGIGLGRSRLIQGREPFDLLTADQDGIAGDRRRRIFRPAFDRGRGGRRWRTIGQRRRFVDPATGSALDRDAQEIPRLITGDQQRLSATATEYPEPRSSDGGATAALR